MPSYKMICRVPELHENGITFTEGQAITDKDGKDIVVKVTAEDAALMNKWGVAGTELVPFEAAPEKKEFKKPFNQLNKDELIEFAAGIGLVLTKDLTANIMRDKIKEKQLETK